MFEAIIIKLMMEYCKVWSFSFWWHHIVTHDALCVRNKCHHIIHTLNASMPIQKKPPAGWIQTPLNRWTFCNGNKMWYYCGGVFLFCLSLSSLSSSSSTLSSSSSLFLSSFDGIVFHFRIQHCNLEIIVQINCYDVKIERKHCVYMRAPGYGNSKFFIQLTIEFIFNLHIL